MESPASLLSLKFVEKVSLALYQGPTIVGPYRKISSATKAGAPYLTALFAGRCGKSNRFPPATILYSADPEEITDRDSRISHISPQKGKQNPLGFFLFGPFQVGQVGQAHGVARRGVMRPC